jgi:hypothetical protein
MLVLIERNNYLAMKQCRGATSTQTRNILIGVPLFYQLVNVKKPKDKFKNSVVTIQEQKKNKLRIL